jgi:hypothetical protein
VVLGRHIPDWPSTLSSRLVSQRESPEKKLSKKDEKKHSEREKTDQSVSGRQAPDCFKIHPSVSARRTSGWPRFLVFCKLIGYFPPQIQSQMFPALLERTACCARTVRPFFDICLCSLVAAFLAPCSHSRGSSSSFGEKQLQGEGGGAECRACQTSRRRPSPSHLSFASNCFSSSSLSWI